MKQINAILMPFASTLMDCIHVNVSKDIREMEQAVKVDYNYSEISGNHV